MVNDVHRDKEFKALLAELDRHIAQFFKKAERGQKLLTDIQTAAKNAPGSRSGGLGIKEGTTPNEDKPLKLPENTSW